MNRFVVNRSLLFFVAVWGVAVALFADGANLDDIFPRNYVVHDEEDNPYAAGLISGVAPSAPSTVSHHAPDQSRGTPRKQGSSSSNSRLLIVYDQDSPSLASDPLATHLADSIVIADPQQPEVHQFSSSEPLHLLLRVLLI